MDELAQNLLSNLKRSSVSIESKITSFNNVKSHIKHERVPETAQPALLECVRLAITTQASSSLVTTGFSTLGHLIKRLSLQDQLSVVVSQRSSIVPALIERLGDAKESYRTAASQALGELWPAKPNEVEKVIRENALLGNSVRAKEAGMQWISRMHEEKGLQFKGFVPALVECLDHADGSVREAAKATLIDLFRDAPDRAKADLKRQLIAQNVRKSIATHILSTLRIPLPSELSTNSSAPGINRSATPHQEVGLAEGPSDISLPPSAETTQIEPLQLYSHRELEDAFRAMQPCFEGKEDEDNWKARDKNVLKLRRLNKGNAPDEFHVVFLAGIKSLLDGILKVANTLRTTMSTNGCQLVQELVKKLGSSMDSMSEILVQNFMKMCSNTKNIAAQNGNTTVDAIFSHVTYHLRLLQHTWSACQDKNVQPRIFASGWLKTLLRRQMQHKAHFEHTGSLELAEKCLRKGLTDANPKVREAMRSAYWMLAQGWPEKGETIMDAMDAKTKQQLEKDPSNPNASNEPSSFTRSVGPNAASNPRAAVSNSRATLRETIAAQKKAAKKMPDRPNSAMATLSPIKQGAASASRNRTPSHSSNTSSSRNPSQSTAQTATRPMHVGTSSTGQNSLMSAPVRRPRKAEPPRPATADPYSNRSTIPVNTPPNHSPYTSPAKTASKSQMTSHVKSKSTTAIRPGTSGSDKSSTAASPRPSPAKVKSRIPSSVISPSAIQGKSKQDSSRPGSQHSPLPSTAEEDNFTLVMPSKGFTQDADVRSGSPTKDRRVNGSPQRNVPSNSLEQSPEKRSPDGKKEELRPDIERAVPIYEDPESNDGQQAIDDEHVEAVLEELPVNEQNNIPSNVARTNFEHEDHNAHRERRAISPSKRGIDQGADTNGQDRAEILKNRRLLASGIDRIRTKTLDPHGFRRLQEFLKSNAKESNAPLGELLEALCEYVESPNQALRVNANKAQSLKSQCLATIRGLITLYRQDEKVRPLVPRTLCAVVAAYQSAENGSQVANDIDKTVQQLVRISSEQTNECIESVLHLIENINTNSTDHGLVGSMSLGVLSRLVQQALSRQEELSNEQKQRMGQLAVKFLDDTDADVRRADTEFCTELYAVFGESDKDGFWAVLKGARDAQLNLIAYYLAKRGRAIR